MYMRVNSAYKCSSLFYNPSWICKLKKRVESLTNHEGKYNDGILIFLVYIFISSNDFRRFSCAKLALISIEEVKCDFILVSLFCFLIVSRFHTGVCYISVFPVSNFHMIMQSSYTYQCFMLYHDFLNILLTMEKVYCNIIDNSFKPKSTL